MQHTRAQAQNTRRVVTAAMPPKNPNDSDPETQVLPLATRRPAEFQNPFSSDPKVSTKIKSKPDEESAREFHERVAVAWRDHKMEGNAEVDNGRERLKRHRVEVAGRVWIPEIWGQEGLLKDWIDCTAFDDKLRNSTIMSARASLVEEGKRANSNRFRIQNTC